MKRVLYPMIALFLLGLPSFSQEPVRVACVGDSITYGDKISFRHFRSYPAILQKISKGRMKTGNFGVNGATALELQGRAWTGTDACQDALLFQPDVVVIMLGINDLFFPNRYPQYPDALRKIVKRFQALASSPRLFVCTLTPLAPADQQEQANQTIRTVFNPTIRQIAVETGAEVIDLHAVFPARLEFLPDGIHPSSEGAALIAQTIFTAIDMPREAVPQLHPSPAAGPVDISIRNEALTAQQRAQQWLRTQPAPTECLIPADFWNHRPLQTQEDAREFFPLLDGGAPPRGVDPFYAMAALAIALNRIGQETIFMTTTRPIPWRTALLRQLVQQQKIHPQGGGYWTAFDSPENPLANDTCCTTYALQAIRIALGE